MTATTATEMAVQDKGLPMIEVHSDTTTSASLGKLGEALAVAQGAMKGALKDSSNPFFKSSYADLASCWDACREALSKNKLAVIQTTEPNPEGVTVVTTLLHSSGEWMRGKLTMRPVKNDPQGIGSCITYARRYALAAMVGIAQVDDDANAASGKEQKGGEKTFPFTGMIISEVKTANSEAFVKVKNELGEFILGAEEPIASRLLDLRLGTTITVLASDPNKKRGDVPVFQIRKYPMEKSDARD